MDAGTTGKMLLGSQTKDVTNRFACSHSAAVRFSTTGVSTNIIWAMRSCRTDNFHMPESSHLSWLLVSPSHIARFNSVSPRREHMYATKEVQTIRFCSMLKKIVGRVQLPRGLFNQSFPSDMAETAERPQV